MNQRDKKLCIIYLSTVQFILSKKSGYQFSILY